MTLCLLSTPCLKSTVPINVRLVLAVEVRSKNLKLQPTPPHTSKQKHRLSNNQLNNSIKANQKPPPKIIMKFSALAIALATAPTADAAIFRHGAAGLVALVSSAHLLKSTDAAVS